MPRRMRSAGAIAARSRPRKRMVPLAGASTPITALMSVLLPAPLGPRMATNSPARTSRSTPFSDLDVAIGDVEAAHLEHRLRRQDRPPPPPGSAPPASGRPVGDLAAEIEHDDAIHQPHDQRHVVLDQQHRAERSRRTMSRRMMGELMLLDLVEPRRRLVEQHQRRLARHRAGDLGDALQAEGQRRRRRLGIGAKAEPLEPSVGAARPLRARGGDARRGAASRRRGRSCRRDRRPSSRSRAG